VILMESGNLGIHGCGPILEEVDWVLKTCLEAPSRESRAKY